MHLRTCASEWRFFGKRGTSPTVEARRLTTLMNRVDEHDQEDHRNRTSRSRSSWGWVETLRARPPFLVELALRSTSNGYKCSAFFPSLHHAMRSKGEDGQKEAKRRMHRLWLSCVNAHLLCMHYGEEVAAKGLIKI